MDAQERLLIEHPVGKKGGYWTAHEVFTAITGAFDFEQDCFGEIGSRAYKIIQLRVRPLKPRKKKIIEVGIDHNYAAQK